MTTVTFWSPVEAPLLYALDDELLPLALQLADPDSLLALRATSKVLRARLDARVRLVEHVCTTSRTASFCFDMTLNHFTKTHQPVPPGVGARLAYSRWSVGDRAFVCFDRALLARRVPDGAFVDVTPADCKGSPLLFASGWGRDVWLGTATSLVHARLTPDLSAVERTLSVWRARSAAAADHPPPWVVLATFANGHGLFGVLRDGERALMRWTGAAWEPVLSEFDWMRSQGASFAVSPGGAVVFHSVQDVQFNMGFTTLTQTGRSACRLMPNELLEAEADFCAMSRGDILIGGGREEFNFDGYAGWGRVETQLDGMARAKPICGVRAQGLLQRAERVGAALLL